jgi:NAD(P)-dependent dehydrogenase (short-subunit alcohol dehydrogenase family)
VQNFHDQVVIVTGASSGIGRETAQAFAAAGAQVVAAARREAVLRELAVPRLLPVPADVTKDADVQRLIDTTLARFGRIDILVNNAGAGLRALVEQVQPDDARRLMDLNFFGAVRCIQAALPAMKRQGHGQIVNVSSVLGVVATPRNSIYCASKFALRALSDALRLELRDAGIEVISVLPGYTDTPFFDNMVRYDGSPRLSPFRRPHRLPPAQARNHADRTGQSRLRDEATHAANGGFLLAALGLVVGDGNSKIALPASFSHNAGNLYHRRVSTEV